VGKHLPDETAESTMPRIVRHAAENEDEFEATQRFGPGFRQPHPLPAVPQDPAGR
jgi:hypothetical protein